MEYGTGEGGIFPGSDAVGGEGGGMELCCFLKLSYTHILHWSQFDLSMGLKVVAQKDNYKSQNQPLMWYSEMVLL